VSSNQRKAKTQRMKHTQTQKKSKPNEDLTFLYAIRSFSFYNKVHHNYLSLYIFFDCLVSLFDFYPNNIIKYEKKKLKDSFWFQRHIVIFDTLKVRIFLCCVFFFLLIEINFYWNTNSITHMKLIDTFFLFLIGQKFFHQISFNGKI
jgi:hypothetical protein